MTFFSDWKKARPIAILLVLNVLAALHPAVGGQLGAPIYSDPTMLSTGQHIVEYLMEIGIVVSVGYFVWFAYRQTQTPTPVNNWFKPQSVSPQS